MDRSVLVTSWDDGHPLDIKLANMLDTYGIPATFYIPLRNIQNKPVMNAKQIKELSERYEVGGHTINHVNLTTLSEEELVLEIIQGKIMLEDIVEKSLQSFCYPFGAYTDSIKQMVRDGGYTCARTVRLLEVSSTDNFEMGTTVHVTERGLTHFTNYVRKSDSLPNRSLVLNLVRRGLLFKDWYHTAKYSLEYIINNGGIFHLWGHSWEIEYYDQWNAMEMLFQYIKEQLDSGVLIPCDLVNAANANTR